MFRLRFSLSYDPAFRYPQYFAVNLLYLEFHRGVFTTQSDHKRNMRESEELVLNAEKYASLAWLDGQSYPATELTDAWKKVLFNQFHDLAAGSGIAPLMAKEETPSGMVPLTDWIGKNSAP